MSRKSDRAKAFGGSPYARVAAECVVRAAALPIACVAVLATNARAQAPLRPVLDPPPAPGSGPQVVTAGPEYEAGALRRFFLGDGYRDLWTTPVRAPVLDLATYAGGLRVLRVGGGFQTQTIHFRGGDDGYYLFRSVNKAVRKGLDPDLVDTPAGHIVQDQMSALHPAGAWIVPGILEAVGVPHERPELYIMPDDPSLGEHREVFAGVLGMMVESPDQGESGKLSWDGSDEILGSEDLLERLEASPADRVDSRNLLAARLVDLLVGDPDRNFDNYRWIGYRNREGTIWRAVPMDRDPAFLEADGALGGVARWTFLPKYVNYGPEFDDLDGLWASQPEIDRLFLSELDQPTWDSLTASVRQALTDDVIDAAVLALPPEYHALNAADMAHALKRRRDLLPAAAEAFYRALAREVDVQATAADDAAELVLHADGSLDVALHAGCPPLVAALDVTGASDTAACRGTYFVRRFVPDETEEVRVYLRGGDDLAVLTGAGPGLIRIRVMGGEGNDVMEDGDADGSGSRATFYDHQGNNRLAPGNATRFDRRPWDGPVITDFIAEKDSDLDYQDWGSHNSWLPAGDHERAAGVVLGLRYRWTDFGFRRLPWAQRLDVIGMMGWRGGVGGELRYQKRREGSDVVLSASALMTRGLSSYRFFGYGNDSPAMTSQRALVTLDEVRASVGVELPVGARGGVYMGPVVRYVTPAPDPQGPLAERRHTGSGPFGQAGGESRLEVAALDDETFPRRVSSTTPWSFPGSGGTPLG